jgi:hypothetical protein
MLSGMENTTTSQLPNRLSRAALEKLVHTTLRQQEALARDFWGFFNSLGYRMDQHEEAIELIHQRLWSLEVRKRREYKNDLAAPSSPETGDHAGHEESQKRWAERRSLHSAGDSGKPGTRRIPETRGRSA